MPRFVNTRSSPFTRPAVHDATEPQRDQLILRPDPYSC